MKSALVITVIMLAASSGGLSATSAAEKARFYDRQYRNRALFGINVGQYQANGPWWPFADAWKLSSPWSGDTDPRGNPLPKRGQSARATALNPVYPTGIYVLTYQGQGKVQVTPEDAVKKAMPGRIEIKKDKALGQITVVVSDIDPEDPPRGFHLWMPGLENSERRFHPDFIERLRPYGVIRGHQWQPCWNPQANTLVAWNQRTRPEHNSYARAGVPYEVFIDLCNELHASPWFSIPLRVDDDFVRQFGKLIKQRVCPDLPIYVEYVNEPWNPANESKSWDYLLDKSRQLNLGGSGREAVSRYYALRSQQVLDILAEVFGGQKDRLVRVLQLSNDLGTVLEYRDTYKHVDAIAINTYFGYPPSKLVAKPWAEVTEDDLFTAMAGTFDTVIKPRVVRAAELARKHDLRLVAYEGGHHLATYGDKIQLQELPVFRELQKRFIPSPRMAGLLTRMLDVWFQNGGGLFVYFHFSSDTWGIPPTMADNPATHPPTVAVMNYIERANIKLVTQP